MKRKNPFFSIIIPCLNEEKYLPLLLSDLAKQTFKNFQVLVVDGSSEDKTIQKAQKFQEKLNLSIIDTKKRNVSHQRNLGAKRAVGKWVIFMDADNRLPSYFLQGVRYQIDKDPSTDVFTCWMSTDHLQIQDKAIVELSNIALDLYAKIKPSAPGAMIGVKRSVCHKVRFDEKITLSEDVEFVREVVNQGNHFSVFKNPKFTYSLRRFKKEGSLKVLRVYANAQLHSILGKKFTDPVVDYPMIGGAYYQTPSPSPIIKLYSFFVKASKQQIKQARKLFLFMKNFDEKSSDSDYF